MPATNAPQSRLAGPGHGFGGNVKVAYGEAAFSGTITTADSANLCQIPAGAVVVGVMAESDDLDAATGITLNIGDTGSATRYFSGTNIAQTGATAWASAATGIFHRYTANDMIRVAVQANATTSQNGNVRVAVLYYLP
jgi:hypothetical protein